MAPTAQLTDADTFATATVESLLDARGPLPATLAAPLRDRYLWPAT